ncbi:MAG: hypothetical protein ACE5JM_02350, partial [Armatimonadota bacterium]
LFFGGPVRLDGILFLTRNAEPPERAEHVIEDIYYSGDKKLLEELLEARVTVVLTTLAVDEMWWGLFCEWYARDHDGRKPTAKAVRQDPTLLDPYREELDSFTGDFLSWPQARFFGARSADVPSLVRGALQHLMDEGLRPRDAFHLALAQRAHARAFVTSDPDFDNLALPGYDLTIIKYQRPPESPRHSR